MGRSSSRTRKVKADVKPAPRDRFALIEEDSEFMHQPVMPKFTPATQNQKRQLQYLNEGRSAVWAIGASGSGKSMVAAYYAATLLKQKKIDKVMLIRPVVYVGNSIGMLSGDADMKLSVWFKQTVAHLQKFLGVGFTKYCLEKDVIEYQAVEHLRGHSFENVFVICEESQGLTFQEYEMLMTRIGKGGQVCFTGDERQSAARDHSGLTKLMHMIDKVIAEEPRYLDDDDLDVLHDDIGVVRYTVDDIQRSGLVKAFCKIFYYHEDN